MLKTEINRVLQIREKVINLGNFVIEKNEKILDALESKKIASVGDIKQQPKRNVQKNADILDNEIVTALSLYCPEARDLRELISYLKISNEFVRVHSNSRSFINDFSTAFNSGLKEKKILEYVIPMQKTSLSALKRAIDMIGLDNDNEVKKAFNSVYADEEKTDKLYQVLTKEIMGLINKDESKSIEYYEVLHTVRRIEKVADRALSIASLVYYAKLGGEISQEIEVDS
jgi:phosphate transport system protein